MYSALANWTDGSDPDIVPKGDTKRVAPVEQSGHTAPDLTAAESDPQSGGQEESKDQGEIAEQPTEGAPKHDPKDDHIGDDVHEPVTLGKAKGMCH